MVRVVCGGGANSALLLPSAPLPPPRFTYQELPHPNLAPPPLPQVRDLLTTTHEQKLLVHGETGGISTTLRTRDAAVVDAVVSTIGFPLVGGPAGR